jgi:MFS family permease
MAALTAAAGAAAPRRTLGSSCAAHALHDGFTDLVTLLLPLWQAAFGLAYAEIGLLRSVYSTTMAAGQIPAGALAARTGGARLLALGTATVGAGFAIAALADGFAALALALAVAGAGASVQHPVASELVARAFAGARSRVALGTYNFAGDLGKVVLPALGALAVAALSWRVAAIAAALLAAAGALALLALLQPGDRAAADAAAPAAATPHGARPRGPFRLLVAISAVDSAARTGFLTFLPFLLTAKGAGVAGIGLGLALVFAGGAAGKLVCGWLGERHGLLATVVLTEGATALGMLALLPLPLEAALALLLPVGVALNGTSSVIYGTVPELVAPERRVHAFGILYTGGSVAGAIAPILCGVAGDALGLDWAFALVAAVVFATLPLALRLAGSLPARSAA